MSLKSIVHFLPIKVGKDVPTFKENHFIVVDTWQIRTLDWVNKKQTMTKRLKKNKAGI